MWPLETPVWRSWAPVRALTVAVIGALREIGVVLLQAGVELPESSQSPLTQPAIWFGASPFCPGNSDMPDSGRYKRYAVRAGVWVDTALFRLASLGRSAPGLVWFRTAKSGSSPAPCHGSSPAPLRPVRLPHSCSGLLWLKYGGGTARLMRHKSGCGAGELRDRVSSSRPQTLPVL